MSSWLQHPPELSDRDLAIIVGLVYEKSGITLHAGKRALVSARLQKRLRQLGAGSFREYVRWVQADATGDELTAMIDAITTNHTAFFREPQHFDVLAEVVLPPLLKRGGAAPILGWSAACSTGEEPYTMAMTILERFGVESGRGVHLLASDLSTQAVRRARAGLYKPEKVADLPRHLLMKYFQKGYGKTADMWQVSPTLANMIEFRVSNLLGPAPAGPPFDFIFCRNVMIYFDLAVQQRVIEGLEARLAPGGYLFTSHSESLNGLRHGLSWVAPAVYRRGGR
jgi:chemotaxis protein methyltransferase CheR